MRPRIAAGTRQRLDALRDDDEPYNDVIARLLDGGADAAAIPRADAVSADGSEARPRLGDAVADRLDDLRGEDEEISDVIDRILDLYVALVALGDRLEKTPTARESTEDDRTPRLSDYQAVFGSWNDALRACGYEPHQDHQKYGELTDEELIADAHEYVVEKGYLPGHDEWVEDGPHSTSTYINRFGDGRSWSAAMAAIGFDPNPQGSSEPRIPTDELNATMRDCIDELGEPPSKGWMNTREGVPSASTFVKRHGGWHEAIEAAGHEPVWTCAHCGLEFGVMSNRNQHQGACDGAEAEA